MPDDPTTESSETAPVDPESTFSLIERARAGDEQALERLFARHLRPLQRWASGRLPRWARDLADTDDLVQDTLLKTFKRIESFEARHVGALQAYLRNAVLNRLRDEPRRKGARDASPSQRISTASTSKRRTRRSTQQSGARGSKNTKGRSSV